jgi:hypothetical protein
VKLLSWECRAQELLRRTDQSKPHREGANGCEPNRKKPKFKRYRLITPVEEEPRTLDKM